MLLSEMLSQARKHTNDNDATNPFITDAQFYGYFSDWQLQLAMEIGYPHSIQTAAFAVGEGGPGSAKVLNNDVLSIEKVFFEPASSTGAYRLSPRTEAEMSAEDVDWRQLGQALPKYYIILEALTAQAVAIGPARNITTERATSEARTMRIYYVQNPAIVSAGTNSPIFPASFHKSGVYYACREAMVPRNSAKASYFDNLFVREYRRAKSLWKRQSDDKTLSWDTYQA